jgi:hypothetical protein
MIYIKVIVICILFSSVAKPKKALFYVPTLSFSHVAFNIKLAELLASNGYDVVGLLQLKIKPATIKFRPY